MNKAIANAMKAAARRAEKAAIKAGEEDPELIRAAMEEAMEEVWFTRKGVNAEENQCAALDSEEWNEAAEVLERYL